MLLVFSMVDVDLDCVFNYLRWEIKRRSESIWTTYAKPDQFLSICALETTLPTLPEEY